MAWDAATWAQVVMAAASLVVAVATGLVGWWTYRFGIDAQPVEFDFAVSPRPAAPGTIPMTITCKSPRAYVHQVWSPDWEGGDPDSVPTVAGLKPQDLDSGDVRMLTVAVPASVTRFRLVASCAVDKRGRKRNVWSDWIPVG